DIAMLKENTKRPYRLPVAKKKPQFKIPSLIDLYGFQERAIEQWLENDMCGLFEMATGTGKTITSLAAATKFANAKKNSILLITVPFNHLVEQWAEETKMFGFNPVIKTGNTSAW